MKGASKLQHTDKHILAEKYFNMIYKLALTQTKNVHYAEDVCQDVFVKFMATDKDFETEEHAKAWLIRVTINAAKSLFTSSWFKRNVPLEDNADNLVFETPEESDVFYAVRELGDKYRTVIHLFYYEDMSISEIAAALGEKENTIKSQLKRGREMLKEKLKGDVGNV